MSERPGDRPGTVGRLGTARALVLLAAVLAAGAAALFCVAALVFGPAILDPPARDGLVGGSVVLALVVLLFAILASVLAARGRTFAAVVGRGCGLLLAGILIGVAALLSLISIAA